MSPAKILVAAVAFLAFTLVAVGPAHAGGRPRIDVDWRSSAIANHVMDWAQTDSFMRREGAFERNPVWRPFVDRGDRLGLAVAFLGLGAVMDDCLSRAGRDVRRIGYIVWTIAGILSTESNRREFGFGFPVIILRIRT